MVVRDQPGKRLLGAGSQFFNESRLIRLERQRTGKIAHGEVRLQFRVLPRYRKSAIVCMCPHHSAPLEPSPWTDHSRPPTAISSGRFATGSAFLTPDAWAIAASGKPTHLLT